MVVGFTMTSVLRWMTALAGDVGKDTKPLSPLQNRGEQLARHGDFDHLDRHVAGVGYWFDFGDDWWHQINAVAIKEKRGTASIRRLPSASGRVRRSTWIGIKKDDPSPS